MGLRPRQLLAYLAVLATGVASLATQPCVHSIAAETPPSTVEIGAQGAESAVGFRVFAERQPDMVEVTARLVSGAGSVELLVPDVGDGGSLPDGGVAVPFMVDATERTTTVCRDGCAEAFEVRVRRTAGMDPGQLELSVKVSLGSMSCGDAADDHYLLVERVQ